MTTKKLSFILIALCVTSFGSMFCMKKNTTKQPSEVTIKILDKSLEGEKVVVFIKGGKCSGTLTKVGKGYIQLENAKLHNDTGNHPHPLIIITSQSIQTVMKSDN